MPPKAAEAPAGPKLTYLGRPGTHLSMGVVGCPSVGKSSWFNVLTKKMVKIENRPFSTIEPNSADINVPDSRFDKLVEIYKPASAVPAQIKVVDIAGLVEGASNGEGLGNAFLSHIAEVDGICHMIRVFEETDDGEPIITCEGEDLDPVRDLQMIFNELIAKDMQFVKFQIDKLEPILKRGMDKTKAPDMEMLKAIMEHLQSGKQVRCGTWNAKEVDFIQTLHLMTSKPAIFLINMSEKDYLRQRNSWIPRIKAFVDQHTGEPILPISAAFESKLLEMGDKEAEEYCTQKKAKSIIPRFALTAFNALNLIYFFTSGADEVKCWTVQRGWKAPQAAGRIHTDMEKGFICAETTHWDDFQRIANSDEAQGKSVEAVCREEGKIHQMGKTYEVQDGDIMFFKFNPRSTGKK